ncbi:MAG: glycosyltransferase family 4 protein [Pseudomonadota bacterium]
MRVVHVITRMDRGGSAQNTLDTALGLAEKYDTILVHGPSHESAMTAAQAREVEDRIQEAEKLGVTRVVVPSLVRAVRPGSDAAALGSLWRLLRRLSPDILHTHTSKAGLLGRLAAVAVGTPSVIHTPHGHVFFGHFGPATSRVFLEAERAMDRFTHRLVALTRGEATDYVSLGVAKAEKIRIIHSGVDVDGFEPAPGAREAARAALGMPCGPRAVGSVGALLAHKGPDLLLAAMGKVWKTRPETLLVFIGQGPLAKELSDAARALGAADRVFFPGWRGDVAAVLPALDVLAHPARNEGMGRVLVEALAAGLPVAASAVGGIPDIIRPGETGLLVPPEDSGALAGAILRLLEDRGLADSLAARGPEACRAFSARAMLDALDALYQDEARRIGVLK